MMDDLKIRINRHESFSLMAILSASGKYHVEYFLRIQQLLS
jgi:hypothetical protein